MEKKLVTVTRSFSYKKGLPNYSSVDFFASQNVECYEDEAEQVSEKVYQFCKKEVVKSLNDFQADDGVFKEMEKAYGNQPKTFPAPKEKVAGRTNPPQSAVIKNMEKNGDYEGKLDREDMDGNRKV
jgi:hypothetical protein